ncbi:MAG TPA: Imm49 family immunity protein [Puia sp.]|nr:Imm49 family immunity protein [Puia sp.]
MSLTLESFTMQETALEQERRALVAKQGGELWNGVVRGFWGNNQTFGIASFCLERDVMKAKQHFYLCGRFEEISVKYFNSQVFDYGLSRICYPILSDNLPFLRRFAELKYKKDDKGVPDMEESVLKGEGAIFCHSILMILKEDWEMLARNLNIMEMKVISKKKNESLRPDYMIYKSILERDQKTIEEMLEQLVSPKVHAKRNEYKLLAEYMSFPALGYAKIAWQKGLQVAVNSPLVPKELLPVVPRESYEDSSYDFLIKYP